MKSWKNRELQFITVEYASRVTSLREVLMCKIAFQWDGGEGLCCNKMTIY